MNNIRDEIFRLVKEYTEKHHQRKPFIPGDKINYAGRIYDHAEIINLVDSTLEFWLTAGRYTDVFEHKLAKYLDVKYCFFVNSGSSANLLAFMALTSPLLEENAIKPGDEVITVAAGFPTTVAPIVQYGAVPVFVDITIPQYNIDVSALENALSKRTKAIMCAHTLGNPFDLEKVKAFCDKYHLWLIEDNCDSLGTEYTFNGETRKTGAFGDIGTSSFYPAHHITTGEGGAVYTSNPLLAKIMRSMRDWGRDCECGAGQDNRCGNRFNGQYGELPMGYDHKYIYSHFGYNLKATDMQAAVGVAQLDKLHAFTDARRRNWETIREALLPLKEKFILPETCPNAIPSWFGFLVTCRNGIDRNKIVNHLEDNGIQTRMLFAGNIVRHPCFDDMRKTRERYRVVGELTNTDCVMTDSFWFGVYPGINESKIDYIIDTLKIFC